MDIQKRSGRFHHLEMQDASDQCKRIKSHLVSFIINDANPKHATKHLPIRNREIGEECQQHTRSVSIHIIRSKTNFYLSTDQLPAMQNWDKRIRLSSFQLLENKYIIDKQEFYKHREFTWITSMRLLISGCLQGVMSFAYVDIFILQRLMSTQGSYKD